MIVVKIRFSDVIILNTETSPTLEEAMGNGGGNIPMVIDVYEEDERNWQTNGCGKLQS